MKIPPTFSKDIYINILRTEEGPLSVRLFDVLKEKDPTFCVKYAIRCCELIEHELPPLSKKALAVIKDFENRTSKELDAALHYAAVAYYSSRGYYCYAVLSAVRAALFCNVVGSVPVSPSVAQEATLSATHAAWVTHEQEIVSLLIGML